MGGGVTLQLEWAHLRSECSWEPRWMLTESSGGRLVKGKRSFEGVQSHLSLFRRVYINIYKGMSFLTRLSPSCFPVGLNNGGAC